MQDEYTQVSMETREGWRRAVDFIVCEANLLKSVWPCVCLYIYISGFHWGVGGAGGHLSPLVSSCPVDF